MFWFSVILTVVITVYLTGFNGCKTCKVLCKGMQHFFISAISLQLCGERQATDFC